MIGTNQPVSRRDGLRGRIAIENADTGEIAADSLDGAMFALGIYERLDGCCCDTPLAEITSDSDDLVLTEGVLAFRFPDAVLGCCGTFELVLTVSLDEREPEELLREPFSVV